MAFFCWNQPEMVHLMYKANKNDSFFKAWLFFWLESTENNPFNKKKTKNIIHFLGLDIFVWLESTGNAAFNKKKTKNIVFPSLDVFLLESTGNNQFNKKNKKNIIHFCKVCLFFWSESTGNGPFNNKKHDSFFKV